MGDSFDYTPFVTLARTEIKKYGREVTLEQIGPAERRPRENPTRNVTRTVTTYGLFSAKGQTQIEWEQSVAGLFRREAHGFYIAALEGTHGSLGGFDEIKETDASGNVSYWKVENIEIFKPGTVEILGFFEVKL